MSLSPLWISLCTAIPATLITFFLGILAAHKSRKAGKGLLHIMDVLLTLPMVLPPTVLGILLLYLLGKNGILGKPLMSVGITVVFTRTAATIAAIAVSFPLMYRSAKAAFEQVDVTLIYTARTLKLSENRIFWSIIMPVALPGIVSGAILSFARAIGEFGATLMIAGNIPGRTQTMPVAIYMAYLRGDEREALFWAIILLLFSFVLILSMNHFSVKDRRQGVNGTDR